MFSGFDEDGSACYNSKEAALERAKMIQAWNPEIKYLIFTQRDNVPLWFAHLVRGTMFEFLAYRELK